jgi:hypothetical protein
MYRELNRLTQNLAERERRINDVEKQSKDLQKANLETRNKLDSEKTKLDAAKAKNRELRQLLNFLSQSTTMTLSEATHAQILLRGDTSKKVEVDQKQMSASTNPGGTETKSWMRALTRHVLPKQIQQASVERQEVRRRQLRQHVHWLHHFRHAFWQERVRHYSE